MSLKDKTRGFLRHMFLQFTNYKYVNGEYMNIYLKEVQIDIDFLNRSMNFCKFERDRNKIF